MPAAGGSNCAFNRASRSSSGLGLGPPEEPALLGPFSALFRVIGRAGDAARASRHQPCAARDQCRVPAAAAVLRAVAERQSRAALERHVALGRRVLSAHGACFQSSYLPSFLSVFARLARLASVG